MHRRLVAFTRPDRSISNAKNLQYHSSDVAQTLMKADLAVGKSFDPRCLGTNGLRPWRLRPSTVARKRLVNIVLVRNPERALRMNMKTLQVSQNPQDSLPSKRGESLREKIMYILPMLSAALATLCASSCAQSDPADDFLDPTTATPIGDCSNQQWLDNEVSPTHHKTWCAHWLIANSEVSMGAIVLCILDFHHLRTTSVLQYAGGQLL
ncbi:unnamed protein product [Cercospora beticola]|nr:unnamed protein product [Cercospora beticola]